MMVCAQKDKSKGWDKNSTQMNQENNTKNKKRADAIIFPNARL